MNKYYIVGITVIWRVFS